MCSFAERLAATQIIDGCGGYQQIVGAQLSKGPCLLKHIFALHSPSVPLSLSKPCAGQTGQLLVDQHG
ncbi:hypothetical protein EG68_07427 [Paragonimus skrjabini miyazakii]|uniref:Uncharacterized protein n=1 Tax=Paragonimus skrjabini miyazakii TaxID=59628 RepID=A0A8S9YS96_9TREM|nr:hypothetical protein EG68_07427 [Paragonimus skrjabini miyazakii]